MTKEQEALKLALEALESFREISDFTPAQAVHAITALRAAIEAAEKQEPVACIIDGDLYHHHEIDWDDLSYQGHGVELLYITPPAAQRQPQDWSVFNTGAEVASGLSFDEAWKYMTPERLDRGWSAVCVVNKDNLPIASPSAPHSADSADTFCNGPAERKAGCTLCGHCAATGERITAQRQPLTDEQILADETLRYHFGLSGGAGPVSKAGKKVIAAVEAAHGITGEKK